MIHIGAIRSLTMSNIGHAIRLAARDISGSRGPTTCRQQNRHSSIRPAKDSRIISIRKGAYSSTVGSSCETTIWSYVRPTVSTPRSQHTNEAREEDSMLPHVCILPHSNPPIVDHSTCLHSPPCPSAVPLVISTAPCYQPTTTSFHLTRDPSRFPFLPNGFWGRRDYFFEIAGFMIMD